MPFFSETTWKATGSRVPALPRCGLCGLRQKCISPHMLTTGKGKRKILFVAEAPGEQEDREGVQLIGAAGQVLRKVLRGLGVDLDDCWKTNAVICRPPNNEISDKYIDACRPTLLKTIRELQPRVIVLLGISAVKSLIGTEWQRDIGPLTRWLGWTIPSATYGAWLCPTYHPSYVLRMNEDAVLVRMMREHLKRALALEKREVKGKILASLQSQVECVLDGDVARKRILDLAGAEGTLAFDYETTGLKPDRTDQRIVSCSFCLNGEDTFACMMDDRCLRALSKVLCSEMGKVASNLKFEERWTRAKLGHGVVNWEWDTMVAAHILDNRPGITSLKFQAYVRFGIPDYEAAVAPYLKARDSNGVNRLGQIAPRDLLLYNGIDSLLEYRLAMLQRQEMAK